MPLHRTVYLVGLGPRGIVLIAGILGPMSSGEAKRLHCELFGGMPLPN